MPKPPPPFIQDQLIQALAEVGRPIMRQYMKANSCIGSARVVADLLQYWRIPAEVQAVKWVVHLPAHNVAYTAGLTDEDRARAKELIRQEWDGQGGWEGHLVVLTDSFLIDAAFDQASIALGSRLGHDFKSSGVMVFPKPQSEFAEVEYEGKTDENYNVKILYQKLTDVSWRETEAWTDPGLPLVCAEIHHAVVKQVMMKGL